MSKVHSLDDRPFSLLRFEWRDLLLLFVSFVLNPINLDLGN